MQWGGKRVWIQVIGGFEKSRVPEMGIALNVKVEVGILLFSLMLTATRLIYD